MEDVVDSCAVFRSLGLFLLFVSYEGGESLVLAKGCAVPCRLLASYRPTVRGIPGGALSQLSLCFSFFVFLVLVLIQMACLGRQQPGG